MSCNRGGHLYKRHQMHNGTCKGCGAFTLPEGVTREQGLALAVEQFEKELRRQGKLLQAKAE